MPSKHENNLLNAVDVFNEPLVAKACFSKNVKEKLEAIENFQNQLEKYSKTQAKPGKFYKASSEVLQFLLKSSIWAVFKSACQVKPTIYFIFILFFFILLSSCSMQ